MGQVSKLNFVDAKLGATTSGQQTTRIVYNSQPANIGANFLEFFKTFQNQTPGQTNLTTNKLDSSESMIIKTISLYSWAVSGGGETAQYFIDNYGLFSPGALLTVTVGNQDVITKLPIHFNGGKTAQAYDRLHVQAGFDQNTGPGMGGGQTTQRAQPTEIRLLTDIVIPPQVSFSVKVELAGQSGQQYFVTCALAGYGKIFSAGSSF